MTKDPRIYNGKKTVSSASGVGKVEQPHVKINEVRTHPHTIHKNKLKMALRLKHKT